MGKHAKLDSGLSRVKSRGYVVDSYMKKIAASKIGSKYPGVSRRTATERAAQLPIKLIQKNQQMQVTRAENGAVGIGGNAVYTQWELQAACAKVINKEMKPVEATFLLDMASSSWYPWHSFLHITFINHSFAG